MLPNGVRCSSFKLSTRRKRTPNWLCSECRAFRPKRTYNYVSTWPNGVRDVANICNPLFGRRKEMKNSTVVPDVAGRWFALNLGDVCGDPTDPFGSLAQSLLGNLRLPVCFRIHD